MMGNQQALTLWLSLPDIPDKGLAKMGLDRAIANRAGGLAWARIITAGRAFDFDPHGFVAVIQPVWRGPAPSLEYGVEQPQLCDLLAWRPVEPWRWWYRWHCDSPCLGDHYVEAAHNDSSLPLPVYATPLDWLRADCRGTVLLDLAEHFAEAAT
jgi:hypothetical protein